MLVVKSVENAANRINKNLNGMVINYDLVARKDVLRAKAKTMFTEGILSDVDYERFTKMFDRLYAKIIKLVIKVDINEVNRRLMAMLKLSEVILWDIVKQNQLAEMGPRNVRKFKWPKKH
jgi:hypothetical protein